MNDRVTVTMYVRMCAVHGEMVLSWFGGVLRVYDVVYVCLYCVDGLGSEKNFNFSLIFPLFTRLIV